jgi:NAD dependent epimerase/dehydratase
LNWKNKTVLITGAGGFLGSHLTEMLLNLGADVHAFLRYDSNQSLGNLKYLPNQLIKEIQFHRGDLRDIEAVKQASKNVDIIFHLGALIAIPYSYKNPREVFETNILGTMNILQAARDYQIEKVLHTSTSEVYGTAQYVPIDEKHPLQGQSPYSASKIGADKLVESFHCSYNLPVTTVRPFNTYGPRQSMRGVISTIIYQALTSDQIVLGNTKTTRDFTYVKDTAQGFIHAAEAKNNIGIVTNLGTGQEFSILDIANTVNNLVKRNLPIVENSEDRLRPVKSEVYQLLSNPALAKELLNWESSYSLDEGLQLTIDWFKTVKDQYLNNYTI